MKFVSCTSNSQERMFDFQINFKNSSEVDFESSRSSVKSESWNNPNRQYCVVLRI